MSLSASSAARTVRPEYSTSSTSTTIVPSMPAGGMAGAAERPGRPQPQVIAVHGDVERAGRHRVAFDLRHPLGQPGGQRNAPGGDAEQDHAGRAVGALQDLVRDPGQRPADLGRLQHRLAVAGRCPGLGAAVSPLAVMGGMHMRDLLSRLSGRVLKDVGWHHVSRGNSACWRAQGRYARCLPASAWRPSSRRVARRETAPRPCIADVRLLAGSAEATARAGIGGIVPGISVHPDLGLRMGHHG